MKTWLMRRSVRSPPTFAVTAAHHLVGMQAALHQSFALARMDHFDRLAAAAASLCGASTIS